MEATAICLRELETPVGVPLSTLGFRDFTSNPDWKRNLISFTSILWHPKRRKVICGMTAFDTDIMYEFDPESRQFRSFNYQNFGEPFEIKIHRSLHLMRDGRVMGGSACLHREDQRKDAPGGKLFLLDTDSGAFEPLGIPVPRDYIQTITVDESRGLVYGFTYPVFNFFVFDYVNRALRRVDYVGSIPHIVALDDKGGYWSTWNNRTHNLFKYDPDADKMTFLAHALPRTKESCGLMYPGAGPIDSMLNGGDGFLYIGEAFGNLDRLDPRTGEVVELGKPTARTRLAAMTLGKDGRIYGISGFLEECHLFAYDRRSGQFEDFGVIADKRQGKTLFIGHDICMADDGVIYVGETDTAARAGCLWECKI